MGDGLMNSVSINDLNNINATIIDIRDYHKYFIFSCSTWQSEFYSQKYNLV